MSERLTTADLVVLARESTRTPMHNATLEVFDPGETGLSYDTLLAHIEDRVSFVPRYRQVPRGVPAGLANPVWIDDPDFDLGYHVRRSALPRPGSIDQLRDLVARVMSRRLDRSRPLWEIYFIEGLQDGNIAVFSKSHQILVDGVRTVDLGQVLLDVDPTAREPIKEDWAPRPGPSQSGLVLGALRDTLDRPQVGLQTARSREFAARRTLGELAGRVSALASAVSNRRTVPEFAFNVEPSEQRRVVLVKTALKEYRRIRRVHGGTVNDVILATITGAIRTWLMTRGESAGGARRLRALVPMSVIDEEEEPTSLGSSVIGHLVTLPIGETSPVVRLHQVSYALRAHSETGKAVAADRIAGVAGFAPTTFHALGSRVALNDDHHVNLVITNVPGPQFPMFAAGAEMIESYPVPPLIPGQALSIGVTSYDGAVYYGVTADRDAIPDADVLGQCLTDALDELVDSASESRTRAPRGRTRPKRSGG